MKNKNDIIEEIRMLTKKKNNKSCSINNRCLIGERILRLVDKYHLTFEDVWNNETKEL